MHNRQGRRIADDLNLKNLSCVKKFIVDGGYSGKKAVQGAEVEAVKKSALHNFQVLDCRTHFCLA